MRGEAFVAEVGRRTGLPEREAAAVVRATLLTLAQRVPGATASRLAAEVEPGFARYLRGTPGAAPEEFDICEFIDRVSTYSGLGTPESTYGARVVFELLHGVVDAQTLVEVRAALSCDLHVFLDAGKPARGTD
ncbi:DUF2267 domain-containing protein [Saccharopolyspora hordei]|uniref:Uncharacterized protein (DUF2267 family) n=1 Tax=Saccharopolyspora hordei TaxID=1838 RepID=A0A853ALN6_9PSEU|nr:DUF2267 domain-containing protein [Saccharopolyspora hordei]NYI85644.1 uncharacterized protein (DUF2267 family) [Saccharopolyspora hordei]